MRIKINILRDVSFLSAKTINVGFDLDVKQMILIVDQSNVVFYE